MDTDVVMVPNPDSFIDPKVGWASPDRHGQLCDCKATSDLIWSLCEARKSYADYQRRLEVTSAKLLRRFSESDWSEYVSRNQRGLEQALDSYDDRLRQVMGNPLALETIAAKGMGCILSLE